MPFSGIKFCGLSVRDVKASLGWNGQQSQLVVQLVQDIRAGDALNAPAVGQPIYFQLGAFKFFGLLQKFVETKGTDGLPLFVATCVDPREILANAKVVLGAYAGDVGNIKNLLNVYGWWENKFGFGASLVTEGGMPWPRIIGGLGDIINVPGMSHDAIGRIYGGPLEYRGYKYAVDFSGLPQPPRYYRIGGTDMSLLDLVDRICKDSGCDYFVELVGLTIRIRTASLRNQPPLGVIDKIVNTNYGNVVRNEVGYESVNETTTSFLVGGEQTTVFQTDAVGSFWGYDINGLPCLASVGWKLYVKTPLTKKPPQARLEIPRFGLRPPNIQKEDLDGKGQPMFRWDEVAANIDRMNLNATGVEDILGVLFYPCSTLEMRFALDKFESWEEFLYRVRPDVYKLINSEVPAQKFLQGVLQQPDFLKDEPKRVGVEAVKAIADDLAHRAQRLYQFVRGYAEEYYGKVFIAQIPFVLSKTDTDTQQITYSAEPISAAYSEESGPPLDLNPDNQDIFADSQGRFGPIALFANDKGIDQTLIPGEGSILQKGSRAAQFRIDRDGKWRLDGDRLYLKCSIDEQIVFVGPYPCVIVTFSSPVQEVMQDTSGDIKIIAAIKNRTVQQFKQEHAGVVIGVKCSPARRYPRFLGIPLRSNLSTYGPWFAIGVPGKVDFKYDSSLVPWNYGGFTAMNATANAEVISSSTNMQVVEAASLEVAGMPAASLGDVLQAGGPNVTDVSISYGVNGVTTSYRFQTFTPRFGIMAKAAAEKIRQSSLSGYRMRQTMRAAIRELQLKRTIVQRARAGAKANQVFNLLPKIHKKETPHDVLWSHSYYDEDDNVTRVHVASATSEEALIMLGSESGEMFQRTALMGWAGLVRPITTKPMSLTWPSGTPSGIFPGASGLTPDGGVIARMAKPSGLASVYGITSDYYNPFQAGNDMQILVWGSGYAGVKAYRRESEVEHGNVRALALRGPLVVTGWGWTTDGRFVPGKPSGEYIDNTMRRADLWKTGPVDMLWDEYRGVWTSHDIIVGTLSAAPGNPSGVILPGKGSGIMTVENGRSNVSPIHSMLVWNHFTSSITQSGLFGVSSVQAMAAYVAHANRWYVIAVDCIGPPPLIIQGI
jgi:hypothetical protein